MAINPILVPHLEDNDNIVPFSELSPDEQYEYEQQYSETERAESELDDTDEQLSDIALAEKKVKDVVNIQNNNLKIIEGVQPEDGHVFQPVEGGLKEPLSQDEVAVIGVISDQISSEQAVLENVAGMLGCRSDRTSTGIQKLYKTLNSKNDFKSSRQVYVESYNSSDRRGTAIKLYKSHCEGFFNDLKDLGNTVWSGIKKLIDKVIAFLKSLYSNPVSLSARFKQYEKFGEDMEQRSKQFYRTNVYTSVSYASLIAACTDPGRMLMNAYNLITDYKAITKVISEHYKVLKSGTSEQYETLSAKIQDKIKGLQVYRLDFEGVKFEGQFIEPYYIFNNGVGHVDHDRITVALEVDLNFMDVKKIATRIQDIARQFDARFIKIFENESKILNSFLNNLARDLSSSRNSKEDMEIWADYRENVLNQIKLIRGLFGLPHYCLEALKILRSMVLEKDVHPNRFI